MRKHGRFLALALAAAVGFGSAAETEAAVMPIDLGDIIVATGTDYDIVISPAVAVADGIAASVLSVVGKGGAQPNAFSGEISGDFGQVFLFGGGLQTPTLRNATNTPNLNPFDSKFLIDTGDPAVVGELVGPPAIIVTAPTETNGVNDRSDLAPDFRAGGSSATGVFATIADVLTDRWDLYYFAYPDPASAGGSTGDDAAVGPMVTFDAVIGAGGFPEERLVGSFELPAVPEPTTASMLGMISAVALIRRKR